MVPEVPAPLYALRSVVRSVEDRTRWACMLEALAAKAGNVHPSASFGSLTVTDFVQAASAIAPVMAAASHWSVGTLVLKGLKATRRQCPSNVNLGILLLLAPLAKGASRMDATAVDQNLQPLVQNVLDDLSADDGAQVFEAIRLASPGGLGDSSDMDVRSTHSVDLLKAMRFASDRDQIAHEYATGFSGLFNSVVPIVIEAIGRYGDVLEGIRWAQIDLLARQIDSLIERKSGTAVAVEVRRRAMELQAIEDLADRQIAWCSFDDWLRADRNRRNPGATADLIAAALWILLTPHPRFKVLPTK